MTVLRYVGAGLGGVVAFSIVGALLGALSEQRALDAELRRLGSEVSKCSFSESQTERRIQIALKYCDLVTVVEDDGRTYTYRDANKPKARAAEVPAAPASIPAAYPGPPSGRSIRDSGSRPVPTGIHRGSGPPACVGVCYGEISRGTGQPRNQYVQGYYRKDGTYVRSHTRSRR